MTETPFADAVAAYLRDIPLPLSTPGHKRNPALVGDTSLLLTDVPFHGGAETLRNETGILEQAAGAGGGGVGRRPVPVHAQRLDPPQPGAVPGDDDARASPCSSTAPATSRSTPA